MIVGVGTTLISFVLQFADVYLHRYTGLRRTGM